MHPVVSSLLASLYFVVGASAAPVTSAVDMDFKEIGKTSRSIVLLDAKTILIERDSSGNALVAATVKLVMTPPMQQLPAPKHKIATILNMVVFSCANKIALIMRAESFNSAGESLVASNHMVSVPWEPGMDNPVNVIMTEMCQDVKPRK